jgi:hypothetical protein
MKRFTFAGALALAAVYFAASALPAFSADSGSISARVQVGAPCITLSATSIDFGLGSFSQQGQNAGAFDDTVTISNCGGVGSTLWVSATNAQADGDPIWTLDPLAVGGACAAGANRYGLEVWDNVPEHLPLSIGTTATQLEGTLAGNGAVPLRHSLHMPCVGSIGAGRTVTMQIDYTATF